MNHSIIMDFRSEVKCFKIASSSFCQPLFRSPQRDKFPTSYCPHSTPKKSAQEKKGKFLPPSPATKLRLEGEETSFFPLPCLYPSAHFVPPPPPPLAAKADRSHNPTLLTAKPIPHSSPCPGFGDRFWALIRDSPPAAQQGKLQRRGAIS